MTDLRVIAAAVVDQGRLLLVSKRAAPDVYYLPGGKPEPGESPLACLRREVREELSVELRALVPFARLRAPAALEPRQMHMTVFLAKLAGAPVRAAEIASIAWWPAERDIELAPAVRDVVIPQLRIAQLF